MNFPDEVLRICGDAAREHPNDIPAATEQAYARVNDLPEFEEWLEAFVRGSLQTLIYSFRHQATRKMKKEAGFYGGKPKVAANCESVRSVYQSFFDYHIAGKTLGQIMGEELEPLATAEDSLAHGHILNARLLRELRKIVPDGKKVSEAITEKKAKSLFERLRDDEDRAA